MKNISIQWKIFSFLLLFSAALLMLLWLFQVVFLDDFYRFVKVRELKSAAASIEKNIDKKEIASLLKSISKHQDISIELFSKDGSSLYSYKIGRDFALENMSVFEKLSLLSEADKSGGTHLSSLSEPFPPGFEDEKEGERRRLSMILAKMIRTGEDDSLGLLIGSTITPIDSTVGTLRMQLHYLTFFMLLFSVFLAFLLAKRVSAPIEALNAGAKLLSRGDYSVRFCGKGYREIEELSDTLNTAACELSKVETLRRELIANVSHDLRTPLTLIAGYAEIMRDIPGENTSENAQVIIDETGRLSSLVDDVLTLSKLQSDMQILEKQRVNLTETIFAIVSRLNEFLRSEGYHIEFDAGEDIMIPADESKLSQIVYNLLINAVNYTGEDRRVLIRQILLRDRVRVEVEDSGEGIEEERLPLIWDRYYKIDKNHRRPVAGTGLGLSIVKSLVEKHGGNCGAQSTVGKGSLFWFTLPLDAENKIPFQAQNLS